MQHLHHFPECLIPAENRINVKIVQQIILVVFSGCKDWIHIDTVNSELFEIVYIHRYASERTAKLSLDCLAAKFHFSGNQ